MDRLVDHRIGHEIRDLAPREIEGFHAHTPNTASCSRRLAASAPGTDAWPSYLGSDVKVRMGAPSAPLRTSLPLSLTLQRVTLPMADRKMASTAVARSSHAFAVVDRAPSVIVESSRL